MATLKDLGYTNEQREQLFNELKPLILSNKELFKQYMIAEVIKYSELEPSKESESNKGLLTHYKYELWDYAFSNPEASPDLVKLLEEATLKDFSNDFMNYAYFLYETMAFIENKDLLKAITKSFYLVDKYKENKEFTDKILNYYRKIEDIEKEKDKIDFSKDVEHDQKMYIRQIEYYKTTVKRINLKTLLADYADGFNYNKVKQGESVREYLVDKTLLDRYIFIRQCEEERGKTLSSQDIIEMLTRHFKGETDKAKNWSNIRKEIEELERKLAKKFKLNIILNKEEQDLIEDKINKAKEVLATYKYKDIDDKGFNLMASLLGFNEYTKEYLKEEIEEQQEEKKSEKAQKKSKKKEKKEDVKELIGGEYISKANTRVYKEIDNARGTLITYQETNLDTINRELRELEQMKAITTDKKKASALKEEIKAKNIERNEAIAKINEAKEQRQNAQDYINAINKELINLDKKSKEAKDFLKIRKEQENKIKQLDKMIGNNGIYWQLDYNGNGSVQLDLNSRDKVKLTIADLSKEMAKYTKEAQDLALYINALYLQNTDDPHIVFTIKEYIDATGRARPDKYKKQVYNSVRLLARERWTIYEARKNGFRLEEIPLYGTLIIDEKDKTGKIELDITKDHIDIMKNNGFLEYSQVDKRVLKLNNDGEYYAKKLFLFLNYLDRIEKSPDGIINKTMKCYIEELQHYGIKKYVLLDSNAYFKREIYEKVFKAFEILERKEAIEFLDKGITKLIDFEANMTGKNTDTLIKELEEINLPIKLKWRNNDYLRLIASNQKRKEKDNGKKKKRNRNKDKDVIVNE